jgi:competence ComEA-like helix-hairpin-helix protein
MMKALVPLLCAVGALAGPAYPDRPGKKIVEKVCGGCHGLRLMENMRKTPAAWKTSIDDMLTRGMKATDDEIETVNAYFAKYLTRLNINQAAPADIADILDLPPQQAEAIAAYRKANGKIKNFDELEKIPGLDTAKLAEQRNRIAFSAAAF